MGATQGGAMEKHMVFGHHQNHYHHHSVNRWVSSIRGGKALQEARISRDDAPEDDDYEADESLDEDGYYTSDEAAGEEEEDSEIETIYDLQRSSAWKVFEDAFLPGRDEVQAKLEQVEHSLLISWLLVQTES